MRKRLWRWLEWSLLITGAVLLTIYFGLRIDSRAQSRARLRAFGKQKMLVDQTEPRPARELSVKPATDFSMWSIKRKDSYLQSLTVLSDPPEAILRIPKLNLEVPVLEGTDEFSLNRGVGRIIGSAQLGESGNVGIAGHRDGFFRGLKDIARGDVLELETIRTKASYVVGDIEIVDPSDTDVLLPREKPTLTLVTCYPFYFIGDAPKRYIVHASLDQIISVRAAEPRPNDPTSTKSSDQEKLK